MIKIFKPKKPISFELDDHELQQKEQVKDYKKAKETIMFTKCYNLTKRSYLKSSTTNF